MQGAPEARGRGLLLAALLFAAWAPLDVWLAPASWELLHTLRGAVVTVLLCAAVATTRPELRRFCDAGTVTVSLIGGCALVALGVVPSPEEPASTLYPPALVLFHLWLFGIMRLRLRVALGAAATVSLIYVVVCGAVLAQTGSAVLVPVFAVTVASAGSAVVLGALAGWALERHAREAFRQRERADALLHNVLPTDVARRLAEGEPGRLVQSLDEVTVVFADLVGFTPLTRELGPERVVDLLDDVFTRFDGVASAHGLTKVKTIGDAYMAVAGAPEPLADHAGAAARAVLDMRRVVHELRQRHGVLLGVRVGMESGPVVAGVIGRKRLQYDLWGETVNTASRLESHGEAHRIQVGPRAQELLAAHFELVPRGDVELKGVGPMATWWLVAEAADPALDERTIRAHLSLRSALQ